MTADMFTIPECATREWPSTRAWRLLWAERIAAIRGMCDLTTNGMTAVCAPDAHAYDCRCHPTSSAGEPR